MFSRLCFAKMYDEYMLDHLITILMYAVTSFITNFNDNVC